MKKIVVFFPHLICISHDRYTVDSQTKMQNYKKTNIGDTNKTKRNTEQRSKDTHGSNRGST